MEEKINTILLRILSLLEAVNSGILFGRGNIAGFVLFFSFSIVFSWAAGKYKQSTK